MSKISPKTLLSILSIGLAIMIPLNVILLVLWYADGRASTGEREMLRLDFQEFAKTPEFDTEIDQAIDRYVQRQEEKQRQAQEEAQKKAAEQAKNVPGVRAEDHLFGDPNAPVTLVEYSDFECPYCKTFHATAHELVKKYPGKVNWVYRHLPLSIHPGAPKKAEAGECVAKLGGNEAFWKFADEIFAAGTGVQLSELGDLAVKAGVQKSAFQECLDSGEMAAKVNANANEAANLGISGTPGNILLNNTTKDIRTLAGAVPLATAEAALNELLK